MIEPTKIIDYSPEEYIEALSVITRIGVMMLQSGSASFRAKDTMDRFARALGLEQFDSFVTPTKIIGIVNSRGSSYTRALRVPRLGVDMSLISAIHTLSHHPKDMSPAELNQWLDSVQATSAAYPRWLLVVGVAAACGSFAMILGGGPLEFIAAALGAACSQVLRLTLNARRLNPYLVTAACATIASLISYLIMRVIGAPMVRVGLIASVLLLVPGVPLVTALLDLVHLDLISGVTRGVYSAILLINIGIGMLLTLTLIGFSIL